ncbi:MAG: hypothetical protein LBT16_00740 [Treponema sp.]|jgi:hypothetical protein|nr:hypothetical protein [Treponema sp.]
MKGRGGNPGKKIILLFFCFVAALANFGLNQLAAKVFSQFLFVDTLFTLTIALSGGIIPGIITAFLSLLPYGLFLGEPYWPGDLFVICSITELILVRGFCLRFHIITKNSEPCFGMTDKFGVFKEDNFNFLLLYVISALCVISVSMCLVISLLGGIIGSVNTLVFKSVEKTYSPEMYFKLGLLRNQVNLILANILARIPVNMVDRVIVVFGSYGLFLFIFRIKSRLGVYRAAWGSAIATINGPDRPG